MVVTELTLTTALLVGAGLMVRSFMTLYSVDLGIRVDDVMTVRVRLPEAKYRTPDARRAFFDRLEPRLAAIPGVAAAAVTTGVPPHDGGERLLETDGPAHTADWRPVFVGTVTITPRFFAVFGVPSLRGRTFKSLDGAPGRETVIINERLAAQFFPGEDPIGRRLRFVTRDGASGAEDVWRTIVGIVPTIKHGSPQDGYENAVVYIPYRQETPAAASLLVRSSLPPESVMDAVRREVQAIDPDQPVWSMQTLSQVLAETRWWWRTWGTTSWRLCPDRAGAVGGRPLCRDRVRSDAAHAGHRRADGAWCTALRGLLDDSQTRTRTARDRPYARSCGRVCAERTNCGRDDRHRTRGSHATYAAITIPPLACLDRGVAVAGRPGHTNRSRDRAPCRMKAPQARLSAARSRQPGIQFRPVGINILKSW